FKPKPMVELGGMPILLHIMKLYSHYGLNEFIICAGYKQHVIKEYFADYFLHTSDVTFDFTNGRNEMTVHRNSAEPWKVTVVDTGLNTMTGGRVKRVAEHIGNEPFMLTYGDGVSDVNIAALLKFHRSHGKMVTMSAYNAGQRFGVLDIDEQGRIKEFREKTAGDGNLINIGFMVCQPEFIDYIENDATVLEKTPLETAARENQLMAYKHEGFWQCMDTVREMEKLEELWARGNAPWKVWND
ncbi:MAG: glucose-1-phosphate cytidylyltransferase, partial [Eubacterium sp.]|nr:glucose-1-phosphate cytidylyltransferase [Eubacterium sp.]